MFSKTRRPMKTVEHVTINGLSHRYCSATDVFGLDFTGPPEEFKAESRDVFLSKAVKQLGSSAFWKNVSCETAELIYQMDRYLSACLSSLAQDQLQELQDEAQERLAYRYRPYSPESAPHTLHCDVEDDHLVQFSIDALANKILDQVYLQLPLVFTMRPYEDLYDLALLYLMSHGCFFRIVSENSEDTALSVSLKATHIKSEEPETIITAHAEAQDDYLTFPGIKPMVIEGDELVIIPEYRRGATLMPFDVFTTRKYHVFPEYPWLQWDNTVNGFRGRIPWYFLCSGHEADSELSREFCLRSDETLHFLRFEITAIVDHGHRFSSLSWKRIVQARLSLQVVRNRTVQLTCAPSPKGLRLPVDIPRRSPCRRLKPAKCAKTDNLYGAHAFSPVFVDPDNVGANHLNTLACTSTPQKAAGRRRRRSFDCSSFIERESFTLETSQKDNAAEANRCPAPGAYGNSVDLCMMHDRKQRKSSYEMHGPSAHTIPRSRPCERRRESADELRVALNEFVHLGQRRKKRTVQDRGSGKSSPVGSPPKRPFHRRSDPGNDDMEPPLVPYPSPTLDFHKTGARLAPLVIRTRDGALNKDARSISKDVKAPTIERMTPISNPASDSAGKPLEQTKPAQAVAQTSLPPKVSRINTAIKHPFSSLVASDSEIHGQEVATLEKETASDVDRIDFADAIASLIVPRKEAVEATPQEKELLAQVGSVEEIEDQSAGSLYYHNRFALLQDLPSASASSKQPSGETHPSKHGSCVSSATIEDGNLASSSPICAACNDNGDLLRCQCASPHSLLQQRFETEHSPTGLLTPHTESVDSGHGHAEDGNRSVSSSPLLAERLVCSPVEGMLPMSAILSSMDKRLEMRDSLEIEDPPPTIKERVRKSEPISAAEQRSLLQPYAELQRMVSDARILPEDKEECLEALRILDQHCALRRRQFRWSDETEGLESDVDTSDLDSESEDEDNTADGNSDSGEATVTQAAHEPGEEDASGSAGETMPASNTSPGDIPATLDPEGKARALSDATTSPSHGTVHSTSEHEDLVSASVNEKDFYKSLKKLAAAIAHPPRRTIRRGRRRVRRSVGRHDTLSS